LELQTLRRVAEVVADVVPADDDGSVLELVADAVRSERRPALRASHEPSERVRALEDARRRKRLLGEQQLDGLPEVFGDYRLVLAVDDDRVRIDALAPLLGSVLSHVIPDHADIHGVVDDRLDRHAAECVAWLRLVALLVERVGDAPKPLAAGVHAENLPDQFGLDRVDAQEGLLAAS
jgi:hypothetical protein